MVDVLVSIRNKSTFMSLNQERQFPFEPQALLTLNPPGLVHTGMTQVHTIAAIDKPRSPNPKPSGFDKWFRNPAPQPRAGRCRDEARARAEAGASHRGQKGGGPLHHRARVRALSGDP